MNSFNRREFMQATAAGIAAGSLADALPVSDTESHAVEPVEPQPLSEYVGNDRDVIKVQRVNVLGEPGDPERCLVTEDNGTTRRTELGFIVPDDAPKGSVRWYICYIDGSKVISRTVPDANFPPELKFSPADIAKNSARGKAGVLLA